MLRILLLCTALVCLSSAQNDSRRSSIWDHQRTAVEFKERREFGNAGRSTGQSVTLKHDFVGGKDWGAGGYARHEWYNNLGQRGQDTSGGVQLHINFKRSTDEKEATGDSKYDGTYAKHRQLE